MTWPRRGRARSSERSVPARSVSLADPWVRRGMSYSFDSVARSSGLVEVGRNRTTSSPPETSIPNRLPCRAVRNPNAAAAANATSDFSRSPVPKLMLAERSTTAQVCSSRSASVVRICGAIERAVRFQSIQRESSPASYARAPATSEPGPLWRPRNSPRSMPSSRRVTRSSRRRNSAALRATGATPSGRRSGPPLMRCPASRFPASATPAAPASSTARGR